MTKNEDPDDFEPTASTTVEVRNLTVAIAGRKLLEGTNAAFPAGKVSLVIGCSGVGKSVLLRILARLIRRTHDSIRVDGDVRFDDPSQSTTAARKPVGVVFQNFALLDELSPRDNVLFAASHCLMPPPQSLTPDELLDELDIPTDVHTSALSGGQKQRLAIARTLAADPDVILFDEPTSGLDASTADQVARLIASTHDAHPKTSIIVTHDYRSLPPIADTIFLLDHQTKSLRQIERAEWDRLADFLVSPEPEEQPLGESKLLAQKVRGHLAAVVGTAVGFLDATTGAILASLQALPRLIPRWKSPYWGIRFLFHYFRLVAGFSACLYIGISGSIVGFVMTYFTFRFLPYRGYTEPLIIEDLLTAMGFALYRILVPVLGTILIAARSGAAVASDIGGKRYGNQLDAMLTVGARPKRYLLTGILYAFLIGTPLLLTISYAVAALTSLVVFTLTHPDHGPIFWDAHYHRNLRVDGSRIYEGTQWLAAKTLLSAMGIALIAYYRGAQPKHSSRDVSTGITSAILWSTLLVLVIQFAFSFFEFD